MGKSDMRSAFRHICMRLDDFKWLIMKAKSPIDGRIYYFVDKCLPFGSSISCAIFQAFSNAIAWIVMFRTGQDLVNYLDDYFFVAMLTLMCNGQIQVFLDVCKRVNFPVSLGKTFWAAPKLTFLGMLLDAENQVVAIHSKTTLQQLQRLCGFLNFLCKCVIPGRTFTRRLYVATSEKGVFLKAHHHLRLTQEMKADLRVWQTFLQQPTVFCRPSMDFSKLWYATELEFYTDASGRIGCGGYCGTSWFAYKVEQRILA